MKYYDINPILNTDSIYHLIIGERSNGKTYASLAYGLTNYVKYGKQFALVRRYQDDFVGKRGQVMFDGHVSNGFVSKLTNGQYNSIYYYASKWYLSYYDEATNDRKNDNTPFAYAFSISGMEHDKSTSYPNITTIIFDEFITRTSYLTDEFVLFMNVCSTIIRNRTDVKIFMLGNTVNKYCPYFAEMGLKHVREQNKGTIDIYTYGDNSKLKVAVEYCLPNKKGKPSDDYFAFDNPKLSMITGGEWEIDIYPHCPIKYNPKDILFLFFIIFDDTILQCEVVSIDSHNFIFIHEKTTDIKNTDTDLIITPTWSSKPNYVRNMYKSNLRVVHNIVNYFKTDKVFYSTNTVGEVVRNYIQWCGKNV